MAGALTPFPSTAFMHSNEQHSLGSSVWWCGFSLSSVFFMIFRAVFFILLGSADSLQKPSFAMPRHRMRPRRGSPWRPRRPRTSSSPSGSSTPGLDIIAVVDTSWTPLRPSHRVKHSPTPPASRHSRHDHNSQAPSTSLPREHSVILHDLVFELREGVNDLHFRVQQMEGRLSILLQLLATPPPATPEYSRDTSETSSSHARSQQHASSEERTPADGKDRSPEATSALAQTVTLADKEEGGNLAVSAAIEETKDGSLQVPDDKHHGATDMQWTGGTSVTEEPWPGILPEYVPDYTMLVPYFSSSGSRGD
jgi:hypothetical protein